MVYLALSHLYNHSPLVAVWQTLPAVHFLHLEEMKTQSEHVMRLNTYYRIILHTGNKEKHVVIANYFLSITDSKYEGCPKINL